MKRFLVIIVILLSLMTPIYAKDIDSIININNILELKGYDLDSKSYNGWLRIFNNKNNLHDYDLGFLSEKEIRVCIIQLEALKKNKIMGKLR